MRVQMNPLANFKQRHQPDVEDVALQFVEDEIGRFDFRNNWAKVMEKGTMRQRLREWLDALNIEANPDEIIGYLDRLVVDRAGNWK